MSGTGIVEANVQLGASLDPAENFVLHTPATPDGTCKFSRGILGNIIQDIFTIDKTGLINFLNNITNAPAGQIIDWVGPIAPTGYMQAPVAATNLNRVTYVTLFKAITIQLNGVTNSTNIVTGLSSVAGIVVGMPVSGPGIPAGITVSAIGVNSVTLSGPTTTSNAAAALVFAPWGVGDGSTTFGCPYFPVGYVGAHNPTAVAAFTAGQNISHTHSDAGHSHGISGGPWMSVSPGGGGMSAGGAAAFTVPGVNTGYANIQAQGGADNLAASVGVMKCIKY